MSDTSVDQRSVLGLPPGISHLIPEAPQQGTPLKPLEEAAPVVPQKNRMSVVDMTYFQPVDGSPTTAFEEGVRFTREIESDEQPYTRRKVATEEWQALDHGWVEKCGMMLVRNNEGRFYAVNPTPEQRAEADKRVIEISFNGVDVHLVVRPTEVIRFSPVDVRQIKLRCRHDTAKYELYLIPE